MADPNKYQGPGSGGTNVAFVNLAALGCDNTGGNDISATAPVRFAQCAASGQTSDFAAGIYLIANPITVPSNTEVASCPGATFQSTCVSVADFTVGPFRNFPVVSALTGNLASTPTPANPQTLSIASALKPAIGSLVRLEHGATWSIYTVQASPSVASPWTVTVDRPLVFPFVATDPVIGLTSRLSKCDLDFGQALISGTGDFTIDLAGAFSSRIANVRADTSLGTPGAEGITHDLGGLENEHYNVQVDYGGAAIGGIGIESQERTRGVRCRASNVGGSGLFIYGSYASGWLDSWSYNCATGFTVDTIGGGFPSFDCWISGGGAVLCGLGATVVAGIRTTIERWSSYGATIAGILVDSLAVSPRLANVSLVNGVRGLRVNSGAKDTQAENLDVSGSSTDGVLLDNAGGGQPDVSIRGLTAIGMLATAVNVTAGTIRVTDGKATHTTGNGLTSFLLNGQHHELRGVKIDMTGTTGSVAVLSEAGNADLDNVSATGAVIGLQVLSGTVVRLGRRCDFTGCGNPIQLLNGGTIIPEQAGLLTVPTTGGTTTLDSVQQLSSIIQTSGVLGSPAVVEIPQMVNNAIAGLEYDLFNGNSGGFSTTFSVQGGSGFAVAQGTRARGYVNGAGNLVRVSPDT